MFSFTAINGRVCGDPVLRYTQSEKPVCTVCVAVDDGFGDKKNTYFYNCVIWGKSGEFVSQHFKKGDGIVLTGKMASRKWTDKNGNNRIEWELIAREVDFPVAKKAEDKLDQLENAVSDAFNGVQYTEEMSAGTPILRRYYAEQNH